MAIFGGICEQLSDGAGSFKIFQDISVLFVFHGGWTKSHPLSNSQATRKIEKPSNLPNYLSRHTLRNFSHTPRSLFCVHIKKLIFASKLFRTGTDWEILAYFCIACPTPMPRCGHTTILNKQHWSNFTVRLLNAVKILKISISTVGRLLLCERPGSWKRLSKGMSIHQPNLLQSL